MSPAIRTICGVLGFSGVAAIAFNAHANGGIEFNFAFFSGLLGGFVFLYAAFYGALPWGTYGARQIEKGKMSPAKWQIFWIAFIVFVVVATAFLASKGVFEDGSRIVLVMVGSLFAIVGIALYFFVKSRPEDIHR